MSVLAWVGVSLGGFLVLVAVYDMAQTKQTIRRNFPIVGHFRYWLEAVGPELRQYIVTDNNEERPFSRDQRRWVYSSAKEQNTYFGFGTDQDPELTPNYIIIKHAAFPPAEWPGVLPEPDSDGNVQDRQGYLCPVQDQRLSPLPCAKVFGAARGRAKAFRPASVVNISAMSFGSLSEPAIIALNEGAAIAGCMHNTGEGGISPHHDHGGELIWQLGTGYFGCRDDEGGFSLSKLLEAVDQHKVKAIEIKLSQGAKPGLGGMLPGAKVTAEIARIRGIPEGKDCKSPSHHTAFSSVDSMLDFVESIAEASGLPVGIKSAVGEDQFWLDLAAAMAKGDRGVDFITIDGGEGGTGAAPLVFSDHVALPFKLAFTRVHKIFAEAGVQDSVVWNGSGKLGFPEEGLLAFSLGCDMIAVAREPMMAIGCIQAQRCHTGHCPAGVATQNKWLMRGLDPTHKSARLANYIVALRKELIWLSRACGAVHPGLVTPDHLEILDDQFGARPLGEVFGYKEGWGMPGKSDQEAIARLMAVQNQAH